MRQIIFYTEWAFLSYFAALHVGYFCLALLAFGRIIRYVNRRRRDSVRPVYAGFEPAVSVVIPTYNMEPTVLATIAALTQQTFESLQLVIVNDGSTDRTLDVIIDAYDMVPSAMPPRGNLPSMPVRSVYRSRGSEDILLLDKENGHKADANNAGINYARHSLVCIMDADSVLEPDTLHRTVRMFIERPETIAAGGTLLVLNGCHIGKNGFVDRVRLADTYWGRVQTMEYIRAFLFGRLGFAAMNAMPLVAGGFGMFNRDILIAAGGFRTDTLGEDMELTLRLHLYSAETRKTYRIESIPDPVGWTEVPESMMRLQQQRIRWYRGLSESLVMNRKLSFRHGWIGWFAMPFLFLFEWMSPIVEVLGYFFLLATFTTGFLSEAALYAYLFMSIGLGVLLSVMTLTMEQIALHIYPRYRQVLVLGLYAVLENFGFRQMHAAWRLIGMVLWMLNSKKTW